VLLRYNIIKKVIKQYIMSLLCWICGGQGGYESHQRAEEAVLRKQVESLRMRQEKD